jgi:RNA polymerase sigma-70 factor (ECF subfamily)
MTESNVNLTGDQEGATSLSLLERARLQEPAAWQRLVSLYSPLVDRWCQHAGLQEADTADIRQEVFMAVARRLDEFRRDSAGGTFRGWLRTITRNKIRDRWRRNQGGPLGEGGSDAQERLFQIGAEQADDSQDAALPEELQVVYRRALDLLATDFEMNTRKAFWQVVIDGQRPADVAANLGVSTNAVYVAKARVLARLRQEFGGLLDP